MIFSTTVPEDLWYLLVTHKNMFIINFDVGNVYGYYALAKKFD